MSQSIYQTEGKPLSQTAIHQQRLRKGQFVSPSFPTVGVNTNASDTAALLAASSDLSVKPSYERQVAQEAWTAALAAKAEDVQPWRREKVDKLAESAANSARSVSITSVVTSKSIREIGVPTYDRTSVYLAANKLALNSMNSRVNPEKDSRHGLATKGASASLNIAQINKLATKNSSRSLNDRMNPNPDYRSGLLASSEYLTHLEEVLADDGAAAALSSAASSATKSRTRSKSMKSSELPYPALLAAANLKAQERLSTLDVDSKDFKLKAKEYADVLAIAQKRCEERLQRHEAGMINLGGGLSISKAELDEKVSLIVNPVLKEIDDKATAQREIDLAASTKKKQLIDLHMKSKLFENEKKQREKREREQEKQDRIKANEEKMKGEDQKFEEYKTSRQDEVQSKVDELKELEQKYAEEKEKLLAEKQENQEKIDEDESNLKSGRATELKDMQAEKDEDLKPTLDDHKIETEKFSELTESKNTVENEVKQLETLNKEYEDKVAELNENLENIKKEIEKYTGELNDFEKENEETSKELEDLKISSAKELEENEAAQKDLDSKVDELEKEKSAKQEEKAKQKNEILAQIDEQVANEHAYNKELPAHLQDDVDESKLRDTGSLFTVQSTEKKVNEPSEVKGKQAEGGNTKAAKPSMLLDETDATKATSPVKDSKLQTAEKSKKTSEISPKKKSENSPKKNSDGSPNKKSGFKKFAKYFLHEEKTSPVKQAEPKKAKPASKAVETSTAPVKTAKPVAKDHESSKPSEASAIDFDDTSLNKDKNQGGIFKEEI